MRRTHHTVLPSGGGLKCQQFLQYRLIEPTAELGKEFRQHEVLLGAIHLDLPNPTRIHHGEVSALLATDLFIGTMQFMFE